MAVIVIEHTCVVCPQLRPQSTVRLFDRPQVCGGCRLRLNATLTDLEAAYAELDPLILVTTVGRRTGAPGSRTLLRLDVFDATLPASIAVVHDEHHDQVGGPSVASVLYSWARDWTETRTMGEGYPTDPTVPNLVDWLGKRLDWACDRHRAIDDFAAELSYLCRSVRRMAGLTEPGPERCVGVPCRRCDLMTLARLADGSGEVECFNDDCRQVYHPKDYETWVRLLAAAARERAKADV